MEEAAEVAAVAVAVVVEYHSDLVKRSKMMHRIRRN